MVTSNENETPQESSAAPQSTPAQVPIRIPEAEPAVETPSPAAMPTAPVTITPGTPPAQEAPRTGGGYQGGGGGGGYQGGQGGQGGGNRFGGGQGGGPNRGGFGGRDNRDQREDGLSEKVVFINRCSKVVKGGRRFSFSALVVAGDHKGKVGYGFGKAKEVAECIRKASESAANNLQTMQLNGDSIPHETYAEYGGGKVLLKPASPGTGIIAGGGVRAVCESVGIKDVLGKSLGSNNHANVVKATLKALSELRNRDEILKLRGKKKGESI